MTTRFCVIRNKGGDTTGEDMVMEQWPRNSELSNTAMQSWCLFVMPTKQAITPQLGNLVVL